MSGIQQVLAAIGGRTPPTAIGAAYEGGYYAGTINDGGIKYYLIVAPRASGQSTSLKWKLTLTATAGTSSVSNGLSNSDAMNDANHPAAQFCRGLTIGGYTDWYLPAKNELEIAYYNLKPTTGGNAAGDGINANAVPARLTGYTSGSPVQTTAEVFKSGGSEAFSTTLHWSSTEGSTDGAWRQSLNGGSQDSSFKTGMIYVRAFRRVPV